MKSAKSVIFPFRVKPPDAHVRLLCFPFAGGGATAFNGWQGELGDRVEVCAVELPGRGTRFRDAPLSSVDAQVARMLEETRDLFDDAIPVAVFGHSMGARIAFEMTLRLGPRVKHLFVSAAPSPDMGRERPIAHLPDAGFVRGLAELGGTPPEVLENADLMDLVLPTLRADFTAVESYRAAPGAKVACGLTAFGGLEDTEIPIAHVVGWRDRTRATSRVVEVSAGHFFHQTHRALLAREIRRDLEALVP